jgi:quercetin dioxygenase-like cupin family protein
MRNDRLSWWPFPAVAVVASLCAATAVLAQRSSAPSGEPRIIAESRFEVTDPSAQAELVQLVVDFESGAWTSVHTHGGQAINLVLTGVMTLRHGGTDKPHPAGQSWSDGTTQVHAAGNTGSGPARLLTTFLMPRGAPQISVIEESRFGPAITYEAKFTLPILPADARIVQQVVDLPPGARTERSLGGFAAAIMLEGEVAMTIGGERRVYRSGDAWSAPAGTRIAESNASDRSARVYVTYLVPRGGRP